MVVSMLRSSIVVGGSRLTSASRCRPALISVRACTTKAAAPAPAPAAAPTAAATPAPAAPASTPASSSDSAGGDKSDSKHSSDIAFKPNNDGWGYTKQYSKGWDNIFAKKEEAKIESAPEATKSTTAATHVTKQHAALSAAYECGALSDELLKRAQAELDARAGASS